MTHLDRLIDMAKANDVPVVNCRQLYDEHRKMPRTAPA
jgi:hypothetical protein